VTRGQTTRRLERDDVTEVGQDRWVNRHHRGSTGGDASGDGVADEDVPFHPMLSLMVSPTVTTMKET